MSKPWEIDSLKSYMIRLCFGLKNLYHNLHLVVFVSLNFLLWVYYCPHHTLLICSLHFACAGKRKPQLVLLDHGLYNELDDEIRTNYASLWKVHFSFGWNDFVWYCSTYFAVSSNLLQALIFSDGNAIKKNSAKLGAGEDLYALFAGILTMRPWNRVIDTSVDHLVIRGNDSDRSELQVSSCTG